MTAFKNARYVDQTQESIDIEFDHPKLGWIEMTVTKGDYPELWALVIASNPRLDKAILEERIAADAQIERKFLSVSRSNFCIALRNLGVIDQQWAVHASQGNLPTSLYDALIAGGMEISTDDAAIIWSGMTSVQRTHQFVEAIRKAKNLTPIQMDDLFK